MTAVEWLLNHLDKTYHIKEKFLPSDWEFLEETSKAMEKEQIEKAYSQGALDSIYMPHKYYNDTYPTTRLSDSSSNIKIIK